MRRLIALFAMLALLLGYAGIARAADLPHALARLAADSYAETEAAIGEIASSGHAMAGPIIQALSDGRLLLGPDRRVLVREPSGALLDAATGQALAGPPLAGLKPVRVNNRLRRAIDLGVGGLTLLSPVPGKAVEAAAECSKSRNCRALPALQTGARARKRSPHQARLDSKRRRRSVLLSGRPARSGPLTAASVIADRGIADAAGPAGARSRRIAPERLRGKSAKSSILRDREPLALLAMVQRILRQSRSAPCCCSPPFGLAITFGVMGVINMAHGEMVMIGRYTTFVVQEVIRTRWPGLFDPLAGDRPARSPSWSRAGSAC
jgi:urea transport system permease protein